MKKTTKIFIIILLFTILTACSPKNEEQTFATSSTEIAAKMTTDAQAQPTATHTTQPSVTPQPTATIKLFPTATMLYPPISSTQSVVRTQTASCYKLEVISETYEDGTEVEPGQIFQKVWELKNTGSCTWEKGTALVYYKGVTFDANATLLFSNDVAPGETYEAGIYLTAPETPGLNTGYWMLRTPDNSLFGWGETGANPLWAQVIIPGATYTPSPKK